MYPILAASSYHHNKRHHCTNDILTFIAGAVMPLILATLIAHPTHAATSYSITYDSNVTSNMPSDTTSSSYAEDVPISSTKPTRNDYGFIGWCTQMPVSSNGNSTCSGTTYSAGSNWSINQTTTNNTLQLFAMWAPTMQTVSLWGDKLNVGDEITAVDNRDGETYTVAKLCTNYDSSNNCTSSQIWMTQNLNFQIGGNDQSGSPIIMTSENTDLNNAYEPNGTTLKADYSIANGVITWSPTSANTTAPSETTNNTVSRTANSPSAPATISSFNYSSSATTVVSNWKNQNYYPYQAEGTLDSVEQYQWPGDTSAHGTLAQCIATGRTEAVCKHYQIGNYYNFTAANAMSNSTNYQDQYSVMDNSICPKGWRLPKGLTKDSNNSVVMSEFNKLFNAQGVTASTDLAGSTNVTYISGPIGYNRLLTAGTHGNPLYFGRSGLVGSTTLYNSANVGGYWSNTIANPGTDGYGLSFYSGSIWPAYLGSFMSGFSIRCLAR